MPANLSPKFNYEPCVFLNKKEINDNLPLRGRLRCDKCGSNLTGSGSKSKTGDIYHYYHTSIHHILLQLI